MKLAINRTIIIGLGHSGYQIVSSFQKQLKQQQPSFEADIAPLLVLSELDVPDEVPALKIPIRYDESLPEILRYLGQDDSKYKKDPPDPRVRGQVILHQYAEEIADRLNKMHSMLSGYQLFNSQSQGRLSPQTVQLKADSPLNLFICLSLADSVMSGLLPDLVMLAQHILKNQVGASSNRNVHVYPVIILPGFANELSELSGSAADRAQQYVSVYRRAKATLLELDHVCGHKTRYYQKFSPTLEVYATGNPLGNGRIWLLGPNNEGFTNHLADIVYVESMIASWLYHIIFTPCQELLNSETISQQSSRKYASFGIGSLSVPFNFWLERLVITLQMRLLERLTRKVSQPIDLATERQRLRLTEQQLEDLIIQESAYHRIRPKPGLQNVIRYPKSLLDNLPQTYHETLDEKIYPLYEQLMGRVRVLTNSTAKQTAPIIAGLEQGIASSIHDNGIPYTFDLAAKLRVAIEQELIELKSSLKANEEKNRKSGAIKQMREAYWRQAEVVHSGATGFSLVFGMSIVGFVAFILLISALFTRSIFVWGLIGFSLLSAVWVLSNTVTGLYAAGQKLVDAYEKWWQGWRKQSLLIAKIGLYENILNWLQELGGGVAERGSLEQLKDFLDKLRFDLSQQLGRQRLDNIQLLCGLLPDGISYSLLTPELAKLVEKEIIAEDLNAELADMRQEIGSPHTWILNGYSETEIAARLRKFCGDRLHPILSQYDLVALWEAALNQSGAESLISQAVAEVGRLGGRPYCEYTLDPVQLKEIELKYVVGIPDPVQQQQWLKVLRQADDNLHLLDGWNDKNAMVIASARYNFTLEETNAFVNIFSPAYEIATGEVVHTTKDREALPQTYIFFKPIGKNISIRHLTALAFAARVIVWDSYRGYCHDDMVLASESLACIDTLQSDASVREKILQKVIDVFERDQDQLKYWSINFKQSSDLRRSDDKSQMRLVPDITDSQQKPPWAVLAVQEVLDIR